MVPSARSPIASSLPPSDCMHVPVLCVGTWSYTVHHPTIAFWDDKLIIRNGADELVSAIHYADPGLFDGLLTLALATAFIKDYSGPQKVDHSGHLHLLRLFPLSAPVNPGPMDLARGPVIE